MAFRRFPTTLAAAAVVALLAAPAAQADLIHVRSTTDTVDAGLVRDLLIPAYRAAQPGDELEYTGVGTGKALDDARAGLADVVITHAPSLEKLFTSEGYSLEPAGGRAIFYSDYVLAGPRSDPAGVLARSPHDAISALEEIAAAGDLGSASFVSRGDNSGTNVQEQLMWRMTGPGVVKSLATNARGDTRRSEPTRTADTPGDYPAWYQKTAPKGQAATLLEADACPSGIYPNGGCYVMVDRGTYNNLLNAGSITNLQIVSQNNADDARGGKNLLINPFSAYIVNPEKVADRTTVNAAAARRFVDFLVSPSFQAAVDTFPTATDPAFRADAHPSLTLTSPLSPTATAGATVPLALAFANKQPGTPTVVGMPVQLQQSTDAGTTWSDVGAPALTDAAGHVGFAPAIATTTRYRVSLPLFKATDWNQFSPGVQELGTVTVAAVPPPTPLVRRPLARDTVKPKVSKPALGARALTLTVSEQATVKATLRKRTVKRVRRNGRLRTTVSYVKARTASARAAKAGRVRLSWKRPLPAGSYRVTVSVRDAAGNARTQVLNVKIAAKKKAAAR